MTIMSEMAVMFYDSERKVPIVVKRVDDFREKCHHQLGKVFDP